MISIRSLAITACLVTGVSTAQASVVTNGGFESSLTGWTCAVTNGSCGTSNFAAPPEGAFHFYGYQNSAPEGVLSQALSTVSGATYNISFLYNSSSNEPTNTLALDVGGLNEVLDVQVGIWNTFSGSFIATSATTDLSFLFRTVGGSGTLQLDNVVVDQVSAVPSPGTLPLVLTALCLVGGAVRRSRA